MNVMRKTTLVILAFLFTLLTNTPIYASKPHDSLKAAFVRNGDLWIKTGLNEKRLTKGEHIRNPKWSFDGQWMAFTKGENEQELWLLHIHSGVNHLVSPDAGRIFQWAPNQNRLAFVTAQQLYWVDPELPGESELAAQHISNFSWLPDGSGYLASSEVKLLTDGTWTPVHILKIPLLAKGNPESFKTLYVLPKQSDEFFAVGTSIFKWSATDRWIAFLATPTASLSADSNTLCVLSSDGSVFEKIDQMVNNERWFEWAAKGETLAYIGGVGREGTTNKQLKVTNIPKAKPVPYTPHGYVDQSFTWKDFQSIVSSRAREAEWVNDPAKRSFPFLVEMKLKNQKQKQITQAPDTFGDFNPISLPSKRLAWIRSDRSTAKVMLADSNGKNAVVWIENMDLGDSYYEQWNWQSVLSFYSS